MNTLHKLYFNILMALTSILTNATFRQIMRLEDRGVLDPEIFGDLKAKRF